MAYKVGVPKIPAGLQKVEFGCRIKLVSVLVKILSNISKTVRLRRKLPFNLPSDSAHWTGINRLCCSVSMRRPVCDAGGR